jgi:ergothioneine biosynthesis protein EgtB
MGWAFNIAIEHRLMHAETLGYLLHWLPFDRKAHLPEIPESAAVCERRRIEIPAGTVTLGLNRSVSPELGWDNEYEQHAREVPAFAIDSRNVTNREFLEFVQVGGYQDRCFWREADWEWITGNSIRHPRFWTQSNGRWFWRGMFEEFPLPAEWPVYISQAEADAFARWSRRSLPTEAQLERAAYGSPDGSERRFPWGESPPARRHGNFGFQRWDPVPAGSRPEGASAFGVCDLVGNGWEWTCSPFEPFPDFQPLPFYAGYSANFFNGQHYVMKGGSALTDISLLRRSFRNWFQPHYPHIYAAFRCVDN